MARPDAGRRGFRTTAARAQGPALRVPPRMPRAQTATVYLTVTFAQA